MKFIPLTLSLVALACAPLAASDQPAVTSVKLSNPDKPATIHVYVSAGSVKLIGSADTSTVTVKSDAAPEDKPVQRPDGLRVLSSASSFSFSEKDNVVELNYGRGSMPGGAGDASFTVTVPKNASIDVSDGWNTEIAVEGVSGDVEIKNMNGSITLDHVGGGAIVETMNGEIHANFDDVTSNKPLSFTSMNGAIEVHLPSDAKANVRFRTQNGSILTDFPEDALKTKTEALTPADLPEAHSEAARIAGDAAREAARIAKQVAEEVRNAVNDASNNGGNNYAGKAPRPPRHPRPPAIPAIAGGKVVSGTLNGGGADIQIATMNGDIVVRKTTK